MCVQKGVMRYKESKCCYGLEIVGLSKIARGHLQ